MLKKFILVCCIASLIIACNKKNYVGTTPEPIDPGTQPSVTDTSHYPPYTWQEHWFDHRQLVKRVHFNNNIAVYFDDDVNRSKAGWLFDFTDTVWAYTKKVYGAFGPNDTTNRLFAVYHTGKYGGGHPDTYLNGAHDFRNMIDIGSGWDAWENVTAWETDVIIHEIAHIVEGGSKAIKESPAFGIWGDSKWAEIFVYDVHDGIGNNAARDRVYNTCMSNTDTYPRANTAWFRNWFYPIYNKYGKAIVLNKYFDLLSKNFPTKITGGITSYSRALNFGEFIHFWSGAAGVDLSYRALMAFGTKDKDGKDWQAQLTIAKAAFPGITYGADNNYGKDLTENATLKVSTENAQGAGSAEGSLKLIDKDNNTKLYVSTYTNTFNVEQTITGAEVANAYLITSGNDFATRDPKSWVLEGSVDGNTWQVLDTKTNQTFTYRNEIRTIDFTNTIAYKHYRLRITENAGGSDLQFSEWRLFKK